MTLTKLQLGEVEHYTASETENQSSLEETLEAVIIDLLQQRGSGKTICPSEVARKIAPQNWQQLMEQTRDAACRLVAAGQIVFTQHGHTVEPSRVKGPIRLRKI